MMAASGAVPQNQHAPARRWPGPVLTITLLMMLAFSLIGLQLLRLATVGQQAGTRIHLSEPIVRVFARPDIVDRKGRLLATDLASHSLFADPSIVLDADEASEKLAALLPGINETELRLQLADKSRRFMWIRRGLTPALAQSIHDLGLPGIAFRTEPRRTYPQGRIAGHVLGNVNVDNRGLSGLERYLDDKLGLETAFSADMERPPVALTIDLGAQFALEQELGDAMSRYGASGAAGVILDVANGDVLAAASLPGIDPMRPAEALEAGRIDRLQTGSYELGSVFKAFTIAMALDLGSVQPGTLLDVRVPLQVGGWKIRDPHPSGRPLTIREVFVQSSNVGAAQLALAAGAKQQRAFLDRLGLLAPMRTEIAANTPPRSPVRWGQAEVATIAYGYGVAVTPLQFAAASAALVNGGLEVQPRFVRSLPGVAPIERGEKRVLKTETSAMIREMMRQNVNQTHGTGRRAHAPGFDVGGKTGTAEMAGVGTYRAKSVIASFLAAFPISAPRYVVFVSLFEPKAGEEKAGQITAGVNAAPVVSRIVTRTGALLGVAPR